MSPRYKKRDNPLELVKEAGEHLYENYYKKAKGRIYKLCLFHSTTRLDILHTWFALMLYYVRYFWDPERETKEDFIARRWYSAVTRSWRLECFGSGRTEEKYSRLTRSLDDLIREKHVQHPMAPPEGSDFEEYEEFEQILEQLPTRYAMLLRDRVYSQLSLREMASKYGMTRSRTDFCFRKACRYYAEIYRVRHG